MGQTHEFLRCIEILTTQLAPTTVLEVPAPRTLMLPEWLCECCRNLGVSFKRVDPVISLLDLSPEDAVRAQREAVAIRDTWADRQTRPQSVPLPLA